jgi:hypothetical protein
LTHPGNRLSGLGPTYDRRNGLEDTWRAYLDGRGTRDDGLAARLARAGVKSAQ